MKLLDLTLPTPAENVALDEALLDAAEAGQLDDEVLRLWEPAQGIVVVGRSSRVAEEVNLDACRADGVPVVRRSSGGAAIVAAPGCLMYAVVLCYEAKEHLRMLDQAHRHVLGALRDSLVPIQSHIEHLGTSDLALIDPNGEQPPRKFSGNSVRCKRSHFLYHGTLLYAMDLSHIERYLHAPPRQPEYRAGRGHRAFVANLPIDREALRSAAMAAFEAAEPLAEWPRQLTARLAAERYAREAWNLER
jgi:lipoate-protein ligase A